MLEELLLVSTVFMYPLTVIYELFPCCYQDAVWPQAAHARSSMLWVSKTLNKHHQLQIQLQLHRGFGTFYTSSCNAGVKMASKVLGTSIMYRQFHNLSYLKYPIIAKSPLKQITCGAHAHVTPLRLHQCQVL